MEKTLLILGAGASKDIYKYFPTGIELIKDINSHLTIEKKYSGEIGTGQSLNEKFKSDLKNEFGIEIFPGTCTQLVEEYIK